MANRANKRVKAPIKGVLRGLVFDPNAHRASNEPQCNPASIREKPLKPGLRVSTRHCTPTRHEDEDALPACASAYVHDLRALLKERPNLEAVIYLRVSGRTQNAKGNLRAAERRLLRELEKLGVVVLRVFREVGSGWHDDLVVRSAAAEYAAEHNAVLVAESADRFLRSASYSKENQSVLPTLAEWEALRKATGGVTLATLLHPDTPWQTVRSYQAKRGILEKCAKCGRPRKRQPGELYRRRAELLDRVLYFRHSWRCSYREIATEVHVPWRTIADWVRPFEERVCGFIEIDVRQQRHAPEERTELHGVSLRPCKTLV